MKSFLIKAFTEIDNTTWDIAKILVTIVVITGLFLAIYSLVYKGQPFSMQDYGMGMAGLLTSGAAILHFKKDSNVIISN